MPRQFRVGNQPPVALQTITVFKHGIQRHQLAPKTNVVVVRRKTRSDKSFRERRSVWQVQLASIQTISPSFNQ